MGVSTAYDTTAFAQQNATNGGVVVGGDRAAARRDALSHSRLVHKLRIALPVAAVAVVAVYGYTMMQSAGWTESVTPVAMPKIIPEKLTMANPYYEGFNDDGSRYWIRAETAEPNLKDLTKINLNKITGELTAAKGEVTKLSADRGTYFSRDNRAELFDNITINGADGLRVETGRVNIDTKQAIIQVISPVTVATGSGMVQSNSAQIRYQAKEYTFLDNVRTTLQPPEKDKDKTPTATEPLAADAGEQSSDTAAAVSGLFGSGNGPIQVTANRLDINDNNKTALFSGGVTASQEGSTLNSSDMLAEYEGTPMPRPDADKDKGKDAAATPDQLGDKQEGGRLKRIRLANPLSITRTTGEIIRADSGEFDAAANQARLNGAFSMRQPPNTIATADSADLDQANNTITLKGTVNLRQGDNMLRGETLNYDMTSARMALTGAGGATNRVLAVFKQDGKAAASTGKAGDTEKPSQGIPFGGNFKSSPGQPVRIEAARLDVDDKSHQAVFGGDVRVHQGNFVLRSDQLTARYSGSAALTPTAAGADAAKAGEQKKRSPELTTVNARGKVKIVSDDGQTATGDWADIKMKTNTALLGGDVVLMQGKNVVRGTLLEIDMNTGLSALKSSPGTTASPGGWSSTIDNPGQGGKSRPSAVFYPGQMKAQQDGKSATKNDGWSARTAP